MFEWKRAEKAEQHPWRCLFCVEQDDVIDTGLETEAGRIYVCKNHVRTGARLFGFSKGTEQDRLMAAAEELSAMEKERDQLRRTSEEALENEATAQAQAADLMEERDQLQERVRQLTERITGEGRALLELAKRS
jgi:hypothetical protein